VQRTGGYKLSNKIMNGFLPTGDGDDKCKTPPGYATREITKETVGYRVHQEEDEAVG